MRFFRTSPSSPAAISSSSFAREPFWLRHARGLVATAAVLVVSCLGLSAWISGAADASARVVTVVKVQRLDGSVHVSRTESRVLRIPGRMLVERELSWSRADEMGGVLVVPPPPRVLTW